MIFTAKIHIYSQGPRTRPFKSGYMPILILENGDNYMCRISLIGKDEFYPGDKCDVEIDSTDKIEWTMGMKFLISESPKYIIGEGRVVGIDTK